VTTADRAAIAAYRSVPKAPILSTNFQSAAELADGTFESDDNKDLKYAGGRTVSRKHTGMGWGASFVEIRTPSDMALRDRWQAGGGRRHEGHGEVSGSDPLFDCARRLGWRPGPRQGTAWSCSRFALSLLSEAMQKVGASAICTARHADGQRAEPASSASFERDAPQPNTLSSAAS
jgi:hypothetical protein